MQRIVPLTFSAKPPDIPLGEVIDVVVKDVHPKVGEMKLFTSALSEPFERTSIDVRLNYMDEISSLPVELFLLALALAAVFCAKFFVPMSK